MLKPIAVNPVEFGLDTPEVDAARGAGGPDFGEALVKAMQGVEASQQEADAEASKAAMGGGNLHELSLALEKADVTMRVALKVRNKLVEAYHEVMRMSV